MATKKRSKLDDSHIGALVDFDFHGFVWDTVIPGLRIHIGPRKASWSYFAQHRLHTKRSTTHKILGTYPAMGTMAARKAASVILGHIAERKIEPGKRAALRLDAAMDDYLKFLHAKSARKGKPPRHAMNVEKLRKQFLSPEFGRWPLADLSANPIIVRDWHEKITKDHGPISANRAAEVLRACYRHAMKLNRHIPPALPTSGIVFNSEMSPQKGLAFKDFPKWAAALDKIESPIRRSFHLTNLLTGCRPGELARLRREDVLPRERVFIIRSGKAGQDIRVILSIPIIRALRIALDASDGELVFPGCNQAGHRDGLPARGVELRRTYRTIAADCGVDEMHAHFLLSHAPSGISQRYVQRLILTSGPALRKAQAAISRRIVALLDPIVKAPALSPDGPQDAEVTLLPALP